MWKYMQQCIFLYWFSQKWKPRCVTWQTEYLMEFLFDIAQMNQNCIYMNLSFNVFKQTFLLYCFSIWSTRAVLGLLPLLFPTYVMYSRFIQNTVFCFVCLFCLDCFCLFGHWRDLNTWLLQWLLKGSCQGSFCLLHGGSKTACELQTV